MAWNPFQFQYTAVYLSDEGSNALLEIRKGSSVEQVLFPKSLLPAALQHGESFSIKLEDSETARSGELQTLRHLLSDLIR